MDKALKQRLVGASVLIILAVIVLPMLLSGRSDRLTQESRQIELPPKPDELSIETRRFPVGVSTAPAPAVATESVDVAETDDRQQIESVNESTAAVEENPLPEAASGDAGTPFADAGTQDAGTPVADAGLQDAGSDVSATAAAGEAPEVVETAEEVASVTLAADANIRSEPPAAEMASDSGPRYLVQVASFSNEKNANTLADALKSDKLPVLLDVVDRPAGRMYRVRVGPYAKRADAGALVTALRSKMSDLTPRVLDLRPDESSPVSTPSDPLVRWVVQVGSFGSAKSAEELVASLRLAGFSAFSEKVTAAGGAVYKVRVGPELDRDAATELAQRVKIEQGLDAFVTTQE
jgi:DedD protein